MCSHCTVRVKKGPMPSCCLACLLPINKDSIEISDAVVFTNSNANRTDVCANLFAEKKWRLMSTQTAWKKRTVGSLSLKVKLS